jgi:hypothetical protein
VDARRGESRTGGEITAVLVYGEAYTMYGDVTEVRRRSGSR